MPPYGFASLLRICSRTHGEATGKSIPRIYLRSFVCLFLGFHMISSKTYCCSGSRKGGGYPGDGLGSHWTDASSCIGWVLFSDVSGLWSLHLGSGHGVNHRQPPIRGPSSTGNRYRGPVVDTTAPYIWHSLARCIRHMTRALEVSGYSVTSSRRLY